eukprot:scaffold7728_cov471-Prasinococcus_capsulatus_cf.AAC.2
MRTFWRVEGPDVYCMPVEWLLRRAQGTSVCLHSVVVDLQHRRRGIATRMLKAYVQVRVRSIAQVPLQTCPCYNTRAGPSEDVDDGDPLVVAVTASVGCEGDGATGEADSADCEEALDTSL